MKTTYTSLPLTKLVPADWNYKNFQANKLEKLKANIKRNGQLETLIVRELEDGNYEVVNGNHRLEVFKLLNFQDVKVCNLGKISLKKAQRIALETNETKFSSDETKLKNLLTSMTEGEDAFDIDDLSQTLEFESFEAWKLENFDTTVIADPWIEDDIAQSGGSSSANQLDSSENNRTVAFIMSPEMYKDYQKLRKHENIDSDYEAISFLLELYFKSDRY